MKLLLASGSPRRKQLLGDLGYDITVTAPLFDEGQIRAEDPKQLVAALAKGKGRSVCAPQGVLLVAADTVVVFNGTILGKPTDAADAKRMLSMLSGNTHQVYTGVYLRRDEKERVFTDCSFVTFRALSAQEIDAYVQSGSPMDKAGSYGIQETDFVSEIQGSFNNIVGFPTELFQRIIKEF
ncbi:MAG: septum formation protein Maf [Clostridia bacterium]|nr:septum formation protein Maf [Clostridia bacterium]